MPKSMHFSQFWWKKSQSEEEISQIRKCIAKNWEAYIVWILPALTTFKYAKKEINCNKIQVQVKISTK